MLANSKVASKKMRLMVGVLLAGGIACGCSSRGSGGQAGTRMRWEWFEGRSSRPPGQFEYNYGKRVCILGRLAESTQEASVLAPYYTEERRFGLYLGLRLKTPAVLVPGVYGAIGTLRWRRKPTIRPVNDPFGWYPMEFQAFLDRAEVVYIGPPDPSGRNAAKTLEAFAAFESCRCR